MSVFDEWVNTAQAAGAAIAAALTTYFVTRRNASKLRRDIAEDRGEAKRFDLQTGWLERLVKEREELFARIESLRESQLNDARANARLEAECKACHERVDEARVDRDEAFEQMHEANRRRAAAEERVVMLTDEVLDHKLANGRLLVELGRKSKDAAERLMVEHLKPAPTHTGDESP